MKPKITLLFFIAVLILPGSIVAQQTITQQASQGQSVLLPPLPRGVDEEAAAAWERRIPEVGLVSAQLDEVVEFLTEKFPEINFVPPGQNPPWEVNFQLRSVTLTDILKALEISSEGKIRGQWDPDSPRIVSFRVATRPETQESKPILRAYSLKNYLPSAPIGESGGPEFERKMHEALYNLDQALDNSFELMSAFHPENENYQVPSIKIEHGTQLLIAVGTPESLEVVDQIVGALTDQ